jgi:hypothetical protein
MVTSLLVTVNGSLQEPDFPKFRSLPTSLFTLCRYGHTKINVSATVSALSRAPATVEQRHSRFIP